MCKVICQVSLHILLIVNRSSTVTEIIISGFWQSSENLSFSHGDFREFKEFLIVFCRVQHCEESSTVTET